MMLSSPFSTRYLTIFVLLQILPLSQSFGSFKVPSFPWNNQEAQAEGNGNGNNDRALRPGDTVAVVGASGNVGKLVALRLSDTYRVNGIVRNADPSLRSFFEGREDKIKLYEANLLEEMMAAESNQSTKCPPSLLEPLKNANAVIICTGTTAFPTKAWTKSGEEGVASDVLGALLENSFDVGEAISSLDAKGLNTPNNVDFLSNEFLVRAWDDACRVLQKRVVMLSSIGVDRRASMPFPVLNACGVLDAKAAGESAVRRAAADGGYSFTVVRPGQLFGGPYDNNYYLGTLFQLDKDADTRDVVVGRGDELLGDTLRSTLAEVTAQVCEGDWARDLDFAVVNERGESPGVEVVRERLAAL